MKVNWIIEKDLFPEYEKQLYKSIVDSGNKAILYDYTPGHTDVGDLCSKFTEEDVVIFHGSIQLARRILKYPLYPGVFLTLDNYECYKYYGEFGDLLLNSSYVMMGLNDLVRTAKRKYPYQQKLFIRPSNGYKTFTGQIIRNTKDIAYDYDMLIKSYGGIEEDTLICVSPVKELEEEWRFVVIDGKVVSGSMYMDKNNRGDFKPYFDRGCDDEKAFSFAESVVELYQPDAAYTLDVCRLPNGSYKVIEINSLCCGCFYGNDIDKIVKAMNEVCIKEFNDLK